MDEVQILIIDDDPEAVLSLTSAFSEAGLTAEVVADTLAAVEKLRENRYEAVVLDPLVRHHLNGYLVLNFIELEQPETLARLFLLTGMSEQTIRRTAPAVLARLFRKPAAAREAAAAVIEACHPEPTAASGRPARRSVLLVEDDQTTALAMRQLLEEMGYAVQHLRNGADVCETLHRRNFDAIILDLVLPQVDGFTVLDQLRTSKPGRLRRVIVATGMPERYVEALDRTAIGGFIRKPVEARQLEELLQRVSARRWQPGEAGGESPR